MNAVEIENIVRRVMREELQKLTQMQISSPEFVPVIPSPAPGSLGSRIAGVLAERDRKAARRAERGVL